MVSYSNAIVALLVIAGIAVLGTAVLKLGEKPANVQLENTQENYQQFVGAELSDKCAVPPGYTEEAWREHMGHHPDRYAECL